MFKSLNGVVLPGGGQDLKTSGYAKASQFFFEKSVEAYAKGDIFPILGICLGFEQLTEMVYGKNWLTQCDAENVLLPLKFLPAYNTSRLFKGFTPDLLVALETKPITANFHHKCMTPKNFSLSGLDKFYDALSTSIDKDGLEFISTMEAKKFPFYGLQWHPEKAVYEWTEREHLPHSYEAIRISQTIINFFVNEARRSRHAFVNSTVEMTSLIYNYPLYYAAMKTSKFTQIYSDNETVATKGSRP
ncbi:PREDICTED: gamma-glutamyl hydrolase-like [Priapulus caudatus]|uniref:folate gamma-glutamyl hydrolase n=1 Tax=Priapulus caudatus TaxID=37621 RepID=A0ABM1DW51_PRICU|nr:PREDICTED: gamma-glutamyl hydrolase-like [Priapulus caudatus]